MCPKERDNNSKVVEELCVARRQTQEADCKGKMSTMQGEIDGLKKTIYTTTTAAILIITTVLTLVQFWLTHR
jgi:hypothetical protein